MAAQLSIDDDLLAYVESISEPEDDLAAELREFTATLPGGASLQVPMSEARFLGLLVRMTAPALLVEIGTFTGYSTLAMARALPPGARMVTCDISKKFTDIGIPFWRRAGVLDRIELRVGPALETLANVADDSVDLVFVDADKANYGAYYERAVEMLRPGGLVVVDNTLFFGRVADPAAQDPDTVAIRELNRRVRDDERVDGCVLPILDGVTLARKVTA